MDTNTSTSEEQEVQIENITQSILQHVKIIRNWQTKNFTKLWKREWPPPSPKNLDEMMTCFQALYIESDMKKNFKQYYPRIVSMDQKFLDTGLTPDFVFELEDNTVVAIEYKVLYIDVSFKDIQKIEKKKKTKEREIKEKYMIKTNKKIKIIPRNLVATSEYMRNYTNFKELLSMRTVIDWVRSIAPLSILEKLSVKYTYPPIHEFNRNMSDALKEDIKEEIPNLSQHFESYEMYKEDLINFIPNASEFLSYHMLEVNKFSKSMNKPNQNEITISSKTPWLTSENKMNFMKNNDLLNEPKDRVFRSNFIMHAPFMCNIERITNDEFKLLSALDPKWKGISEIEAIHEATLEEQTSLSRLMFLKSFLKGEAKDINLNKIAEELGIDYKEGEIILRGELFKKIDLEVLKILALAEAKVHTTDIRMSKHGKFLFPQTNELFKKAHINFEKEIARRAKLSKEEDDKLETLYEEENIEQDFAIPPVGEFGNSMAGFEIHYRKIETLGLYPRHDIEIPNFKDAYIRSNTKMNNLSNACLDEGIKLLQPTLDSLGSSLVFYQQKWKGTLIASTSRLQTKNYRHGETSLVRDVYTGLTTLSTPTVSEILSGALIIYGKFKTVEMEEVFEWIGPLNIWEIGDYTYFLSKPFRLNWQESISCDMHLYGSIAASCTFSSFKFNVYDEPLFWSLFLNFSRQLKYTLDIVYMMYQCAFSSISLGKEDIAGKFELKVSDARCTAIMYRMFLGHKKFASDAFKTTQESRDKQLVGVHDLIFPNKIHTGWNSFMCITFLKQCLTREDGCDPVFYLGKFFNLDMSYERWYKDSPFNGFSNTSDINLYEFFDKMILNQDRIHWCKVGFHPGMSYRLYEKYFKVVLKERKQHLFTKEWEMPCLNTAVSSSVMVSKEMVKFYNIAKPLVETDYFGRFYENVDEQGVKKKKKEPYAGVQTQKLLISLIQEERSVKHFLDIYKRHGNKFKIFRKDFTIPRNFKINDRQLTLWQLTYIQTLIYPLVYLLMMMLKAEVSYGKRPFFIQTLFGRNLNRIRDMVAQAPLSTTINKSDLIMIPGLEKNMKIQQRMRDLKIINGDMSMSIDMAKFMDTMMNGTFKMQDVAARDLGVISEEEYTLLAIGMQAMEEKAVLMPHQYRDSILNIENKMEKKIKVFNKDRSHVSEIREGNAKEMLNDKSVKEELIRNELMKEAANNEMGVKKVGCVLGTFNKGGSFSASTHTHLVIEIINELFSENMVTANTSSDDCDYHTKFPLPKSEDFKLCDQIQNVLNLRFRILGIEETGEYIFENRRVYLKYSNRQIRTDFKEIDYINWKLYVSNDLIADVSIMEFYENMEIARTTKMKIKGKFFMGTKHLRVKYEDGYILKTKYKNIISTLIFLIIALFAPRTVSHRPSLLKVKLGTGSEMLQQIHPSNGNVYIPFMRYPPKLLAALNGKSMADDLHGAIGRVYDLVCNRAPVNLVVASMIIVNIGVGSRMGVPAKERDINELPNTFGLYWCTPDALLRFGFSANTARLLASVSGEINIHKSQSRYLQLMMNTEAIWKVSKKSIKDVEQDEPKVDEMSNLFTINSPDNIDPNTSAVEVFKDFFLTFNRYKRTTIEFEKLISAHENDLKKLLGKDNISGLEAFEILKKELGPLLSVNSRSSVHKLVSTLAKMKTSDYSSQAIRASPDIYLVARFGYYNRIFSNPFSLYVNQYMEVKGEKLEDSVTLTQVFNTIRILSKDANFKIPELHSKCLKQMKENYLEPISDIVNFVITYTIRQRSLVLFEDDKTEYIKINYPNFLSYDTRLLTYAFALYIDQLRHPEKVEESRLVYLINPSLMNDRKFEEYLIEVKSLCRKFEILDPDSIDRHTRLLVMMFAPLEFKGVVNLPAGEYGNMNYIARSFTYDKILELHNYQNKSETYIIKGQEEFKIIESNYVERILLLTMWNNYFNSLNIYAKIQIAVRKKILPTNYDLQIINHMNELHWNALWSSNFYTLLLGGVSQMLFEITLDHTVKNNWIYVFFKYKNWPGIGLKAEIGENMFWSIAIIDNKNDYNPIESHTYFISIMSVFLSHIVYQRKQGIKGTRSIKRFNSKRNYAFKAFDEYTITYQSNTAPDEFPVLDIIQYKKKKELYLNFFGDIRLNKYQFNGVGMQFNKYLITPWEITDRHTKLRSLTTYKSFEPLELDDSNNQVNPDKIQTILILDFHITKSIFRSLELETINRLFDLPILKPTLKAIYFKNNPTFTQSIDIQISLFKAEFYYCLILDPIVEFLFGKYKNIGTVSIKEISKSFLELNKISTLENNGLDGFILLKNSGLLNELGLLRLNNLSITAQAVLNFIECSNKLDNTLPDWIYTKKVLKLDSEEPLDNYLMIEQITKIVNCQCAYIKYDFDLYLCFKNELSDLKLRQLSHKIYLGEKDFEPKITEIINFSKVKNNASTELIGRITTFLEIEYGEGIADLFSTWINLGKIREIDLLILELNNLREREVEYGNIHYRVFMAYLNSNNISNLFGDFFKSIQIQNLLFNFPIEHNTSFKVLTSFDRNGIMYLKEWIRLYYPNKTNYFLKILETINIY